MILENQLMFATVLAQNSTISALNNCFSLKRMSSQDLAFANPLENHIAIRRPPHCLHCGGRTKERPCQQYNTNGYAYRPYSTCSACFGDMRGVLAENPTCYCDDGMQFTRRAIAGPDGAGRVNIPRSIFYQCATGGVYVFWTHDRQS